MLQEDQLSPWQVLPDSVILHIFSFIDAPTLVRTALTCKSWNRVACDEFLWKDLFCKEWNLSRNVSRKPGKYSWREEYKRLRYNTPMVESEVLREHIDEVFHVCFSHNGNMFATCSKDRFVKVWNADYPATMLHNTNMTEYGWNYVQFSKFNKTDTLLLVSGAHTAPQSTGEIFVFSIHGEFEIQNRILINPHDVYGTWYNENYIISSQQCWLNSNISNNIVWLNCANKETDSHDATNLFKFRNENFSSIRNIMVSNSYLSAIEESPHEDSVARGNLTQDCEKLLLDDREKLLIFTTGSKTYAPHQIGFKRIKPFRLSDRNSNKRAGNSVQIKDRFQLDLFMTPNYQDETIDKVDHLIEMQGHVIGLALSPDHRFLYANVRAWPKDYDIDDPDELPPIAQEIDIHVIDLVTLKEVGIMFGSHKAYTSKDDCFYIFLDVCDEFVASGAEDKFGYLWDRHYGICLSKFPHNDAVICVAFNPIDSEMLITVSDDHSVKIWRSKNRAKEIEATLSTSVNEKLKI